MRSGLYGAYNGPLYQVRRSSDNATQDIGVLSGAIRGGTSGLSPMFDGPRPNGYHPMKKRGP